MRVALVSPYSYGYPGGVARHVEALADELVARGHHVRLLAPHDPDDRLTRVLHRGARPQPRAVPDYLIPLGRTVAIAANGARSNLGVTLEAIGRLSNELRHGGYDVVHVHEPNAPLVGWCAVELAHAPLVGTFHAHSTSRGVNFGAANVIGARRLYNKLRVRIAVSEAARWTAERFYGGRYRVVPNGVDLAAARSTPPVSRDRSDGLHVVYLGRAERRKGLPVLLSAFESLRAAGRDVRLTIAGAEPDTVPAHLRDAAGVVVVGPVGEREKWRLLRDADLLCAPSLGGESFGMVLVDALAVGTPVVCSDIAGYREIVRDGSEGALVPPGRSTVLAAALDTLRRDPSERARMGEAARARAERFAWPRVADDVIAAYEEARDLPLPAGAIARAAARLGLRGAERGATMPRAPKRAATAVSPRRTRVAACAAPGRPPPLAPALAVAAALAALALAGPHARLFDGRLLAAPLWALGALAFMATSLLLRAEAWTAILRASLGPGLRVRRSDAARATMIGVLMSASLPARLGEIARALVMAGHLGRVRERLPLVAGTIVSQTLLNLLALACLGTIVVAARLAGGSEEGLALATFAPAALLVAGVAATALVRSDRAGGHRTLRRALSASLARLRRGLAVFGRVGTSLHAAAAQLAAWGLQLLGYYLGLVAFGLDGAAGLGGAAAVLCAVNASAMLPGLPANVGVFQAACVAALAVYGVSYGDALTYGVGLQALELGVAVALGIPALVREGSGWRAMRRRTLHAAPLAVPAERATASAPAYNRRREIFDSGR